MGAVYNKFGLGGGGCKLPICNGLATNSSYISLPYTISSDYDVYYDFTVNSYQENCSVLGNTANNGNYLNLTIFNNQWYAPTGGGMANWSATFPGRHTFHVNHNGKMYFDGVEKANYTPTSAHYTILLGKRRDLSTIFNGIIHEFKITSISTGEVICDYVPAQIIGSDGLYDKANNIFLPWGHASLSGSAVDTVYLTELPALDS